jgi:hypothetical protein
MKEQNSLALPNSQILNQNTCTNLSNATNQHWLLDLQSHAKKRKKINN